MHAHSSSREAGYLSPLTLGGCPAPYSPMHVLLLPLAARYTTKYWLVLLVGLIACLGLGSRLGYHFPQADAHPDWSAFPQLKTQHLVVEHLADFDARYRHRYQLRRTMRYGVRFGDSEAVDSPRVSAVRELWHRVSHNTFQATVANPYSNAGIYAGPVEEQGFNQYGDAYMEVDLAGEKGYFKQAYASYLPSFYFIHQYNQPTSRQDTLFL